MSESEKYITLATAAEGTPYSQEYLSLLARRGKLPAKKFGRNWHTTRRSLEEYLAKQQHTLLQELEKKTPLRPPARAGRRIEPLSRFARNALFASLIAVFFFGIGAFGMNLAEDYLARTHGARHFPEGLGSSVVVVGKLEWSHAGALFGQAWDKTAFDFRNFATVAGKRAGIFDNPLFQRIIHVADAVGNAALDAFDAIRVLVFGPRRLAEEEIFFPPRETKAPTPVLTPPQQAAEEKVAPPREVVVRREVTVPADLAVFRRDLVSYTDSSVRALRDEVDGVLDNLSASVSQTDVRAGSGIQMITISQKIDQLDSLDVFNGLTVQSGDLTIKDGSLTAKSLTASGGNLSVSGILIVSGSGTSTFAGPVTIAGILTANNNSLTVSATTTASNQFSVTRVPTLMHTFGSWAINVADSNVTDASLLINPASAAADTNLFGIAVAGGVKFLVDAEGDVFVNSLTSVGGTVLATTTASTFTVENNFTAGDAIGDVINIYAGTINYFNRATSTIASSSPNSFTFATSTTATPILSLDGLNGRVGVGTATPYALLSVHASTTATALAVRQVDSGNQGKLVEVYDGATPAFVIDSSGQVGIGTTSPAKLLHLWGTASVENRIETTGATSLAVANYKNPSVEWDVGVDGALSNSFKIRQAGVDDRFVITTSGNVGIGTTSPNSILHVHGASGSQVRFSDNTTGSATGDGFLVGYTSAQIAVLQNRENTDMQFLTNNVERVTITAAGNVGIGTTSPGAKLDIQGTTGTTINLDNTGTGDARFILDSGGTGSRAWTIGSSGQDASIVTAGYLFVRDSTSGNNRLVIDSSGNVGIGTTSPLAPLHILGTTNTADLIIDNSGTRGGNIQFSKSATNYGAVGISGKIEGDASTDIGILANSIGGGLRFYVNASANEVAVINSSGNVGIGTTSPAAKLQVSGANSQMLIEDSDNGKRWGFTTSDNADFSIRENDFTDANTRLMIKAGGNVGIGTTSPVKLLELFHASDPRIRMDRNGVIITEIGSDSLGGYVQTTTNHPIRFFPNAVERMRITTDGNVGIGTTSPATLLSVSATAPNVTIAATGVGSAGPTLLDFWAAGRGFTTTRIRAEEGGAVGRGTFNLQLRNDAGTLTSVIYADGQNGNVGIGTTGPGGQLDVRGTTILRKDTNGLGVALEIPNLDTTAATLHSVAIDYQLADTTGGSLTNAARIIAGKEQEWTGVAATRDSFLAFSTDQDAIVNERVRITSGGNVGIGTTSPSGLLNLAGTDGNGIRLRFTQNAPTTRRNWQIAIQDNTNDTFEITPSTAAGNLTFTSPALVIAAASGNVGIGTSSPMEKLAVSGGNIAASGCLKDAETGVNNAGTCVDIAEAYVAGEDLTPGDIVAVQSDPSAPEGFSIVKARKSSEVEPPTAAILGIISTRPAVYMQGDLAYFGGSRFSASSIFPAGSEAPLALAGRVPVKVSLEGGPIKIGDRITSSSMPGVGMKATTSGVTIGIALEPFDGKSSEVEPPQGGSTSPYPVGKILVFVNLGYSRLDGEISSSNGSTSVSSLTVDQTTGRITATVGLDLKGNDIINVSRIVSANGTWSISEDGTLMATKVITEELIAQRIKVELGVTTRDRTSGTYYCIFVDSGAVKTEAGECGSITNTTATADATESASEAPTATTTPVESAAPPQGEPIPEPTPAPEPTAEEPASPPAPISTSDPALEPTPSL